MFRRMPPGDVAHLKSLFSKLVSDQKDKGKDGSIQLNNDDEPVT